MGFTQLSWELKAKNILFFSLASFDEDAYYFGVFGSAYVAFGVTSLFGLRFPLKFVPILLLQLSYKIVWFAWVALPLAVKGQFPAHGYVFAAIFQSYIIGDLIAIPFSYLFGKSKAEKNIATT